MSSPVAFIIGAGSGVGRSVGLMLKKIGYSVALGSRNSDKDVLSKEDGFTSVAIDVTKSDTIVAAFDSVKKELGAPPSVVVFNGTHRSLLGCPERVCTHSR
jgi:NAD(P)-dependent dehydrogenase (short-subunit alcohol dehydrogenase family)